MFLGRYDSAGTTRRVPVAMPGPSEADSARAVARERVTFKCKFDVDSGLPIEDLRQRRLRLVGLGPPSKLSIRRFTLIGLDVDILTSDTSSATVRWSQPSYYADTSSATSSAILQT